MGKILYLMGTWVGYGDHKPKPVYHEPNIYV